jgi:spermidine/putrescine transport system permease protein
MKRAVKSAYLGIVTLFLYLPLAVLIIYSFNDAKHVVTWKGFTTRWYAKLAENTVLLDAAVNSLLLAAASATAAAIIGTLAAIALKRYRFKGRAILSASMYVVMMSRTSSWASPCSCFSCSWACLSGSPRFFCPT